MNIDIVGDGEYFVAEIEQSEYPTDYERCKITIKPTPTLLDMLDYLKILIINHQDENHE